MRLALVVNAFPVVSETFILNKAMALIERGVDLEILAHAPSNDHTFFEARVNCRSLPPVRLALTTGSVAVRAARTAAAIACAPGTASALHRASSARYGTGRRGLRAWAQALPLVAGGYDVVHFEYSGLAATYLDALPLLRPAKIVASCRGAAEQITPLIDPRRGELLKRVFGAVDRIHCVSADMLRTIVNYEAEPSRAFINHPSIDSSQFRRTTPYPIRSGGPYRIATTGRLHWKKGLEFALAGVRKLVDAGFDVQYDIVGGGPEEERLRFAIHDLGIADRVRIHGRQPSAVVREIVEKADVFLLPSLSEGLSNAALEAMAMEVPVVSTAAGGMTEAIVDGEHGLIIPSRDPQAICDGIASLLSDADLRRSLGAAARVRVEREFTLERQADQFVREYNALSSGV